MEVELEDTKILWPGGVLYGGGETYENDKYSAFLLNMWYFSMSTCTGTQQREARNRLHHPHLRASAVAVLHQVGNHRN